MSFCRHEPDDLVKETIIASNFSTLRLNLTVLERRLTALHESAGAKQVSCILARLTSAKSVYDEVSLLAQEVANWRQ